MTPLEQLEEVIRGLTGESLDDAFSRHNRQEWRWRLETLRPCPSFLWYHSMN
jgi:hypothetical protein